MRFPNVVRNSENDLGHSPAWAKSRRRSRGNGGGAFVGFLVTLLALFGALTAVLAIKERSVERGGAVIDGWIAVGVQTVREATGQAPEVAEAAVEKAGNAAEKTGDALQAGAEKAGDELKAQ